MAGRGRRVARRPRGRSSGADRAGGHPAAGSSARTWRPDVDSDPRGAGDRLGHSGGSGYRRGRLVGSAPGPGRGADRGGRALGRPARARGRHRRGRRCGRGTDQPRGRGGRRRPGTGRHGMGRLTLVLGGQKAGKSKLAARHAAASGRPVVVVAPAVVRDAEFAARVKRHLADRPSHWLTVETFDLGGAVADAERDAFVLVDALDTWLAEVLEADGVEIGDETPDPARNEAVETRLLARLRAFTDAAARHEGETWVIAGQPGLGVHAAGPGARWYVDLHGLCVQALSAAADDVFLVVGGRVAPLERLNPAGDVQSALRSHGDTQVPPGAVDLA